MDTAKQPVHGTFFVPQSPKYLAIFRLIFLQFSLGRAEQHPQAQRDKILLSYLKLVLMHQKDSGSPTPASSSCFNPCRVYSLLPKYINPSPTKDRSLKVRQSVLYAANYIIETTHSPGPFFSSVSIATQRWRPIKVTVPLINQNQKIA